MVSWPDSAWESVVVTVARPARAVPSGGVPPVAPRPGRAEGQRQLLQRQVVDEVVFRMHNDGQRGGAHAERATVLGVRMQIVL